VVEEADPWVLVAIAAITAGAAIVAAVIAAKTAASRQRRQLEHDHQRHQQQLEHDLARQERQLEHDLRRQNAELRHERELQELEDRRRVLDDAAEFLIVYRERVAKGLRPLSQGLPEASHLEDDDLPVLATYSRDDALKFRQLQARLSLRFGIDHEVTEAFLDAKDEIKRGILVVGRGAQASRQQASSARSASRKAVRAFTAAAREALTEARVR
jgi:hypothetical protein